MSARDSLLSSLVNGSTSTLSMFLTPLMKGPPALYQPTETAGTSRHVPMAEPGPGQTGQSIVKLHALSTFTAREHPFHPAKSEAEIMLKVVWPAPTFPILKSVLRGQTADVPSSKDSKKRESRVCP